MDGAIIITIIGIYCVFLNLYFFASVYYYFYVGGGLKWKLEELSWAKRAAEEAEAAAAISCSGHGNAYLDGLLVHGTPICECNTCFSGPDCSHFNPKCFADADSGDPLFMEPFWMQHAASSALVVAGWHRMSYSFNDDDDNYISHELEKHIRKVHAIAKNAVTTGKYIVFGAGSTQLLSAAVYALSPENSSSPAAVVASIPYYPVYESQTDFFRSIDFSFKGDSSLWKNSTDGGANIIEFVTSPNNPDCQLNKATLQGSSVKTIHDHAYYWPHFTPIPAPSNEDLMIFTISKLTGHAGSRFGWSLVKDEAVYQRMVLYVARSTIGVSRDTQLRALKLLKVILQGDGREIFDFAYETMSKRWEKLRTTISMSRRFSIQEIPSHLCIFSQKVRGASPAYAWLKCELEEDKDCTAVLRAAKIIGRQGFRFGAGDRHVRLSLIRRQDEFNLLLQRLNKVISEESSVITRSGTQSVTS